MDCNMCVFVPEELLITVMNGIAFSYLPKEIRCCKFLLSVVPRFVPLNKKLD